MKRRLLIYLLVVIMAFSLPGCGQKGADPDESNIAEKQQRELKENKKSDGKAKKDPQDNGIDDNKKDTNKIKTKKSGSGDKTQKRENTENGNKNVNKHKENSDEVTYSYDGRDFTVNGVTVGIDDFEPAANAIMDMYRVGDWIVVEGHINPHVGAYCCYNIYTETVEKTIVGANLTWKGDDLTTAVYSNMDGLYNFKEHLIGTTDGTEISEVYFSSAPNEVFVRDFEDFEYRFEISGDDEAMYRYADYVRKGTPESWDEFTRLAPDNAIAFVMVNPPEDSVDLMPDTIDIMHEDIEHTYVVSLMDETDIRLDYGEFDIDSFEFVSDETVDKTVLRSGSARGYDIVAAEGMPIYCIFIKAGKNEGNFPISVISGESDVCGEFIEAK